MREPGARSPEVCFAPGLMELLDEHLEACVPRGMSSFGGSASPTRIQRSRYGNPLVDAELKCSGLVCRVGVGDMRAQLHATCCPLLGAFHGDFFGPVQRTRSVVHAVIDPFLSWSSRGFDRRRSLPSSVGCL